MRYFLVFSLAVLGQLALLADQCAVVTADRVNLRAMPLATSLVVGQVSKDARLVAVERYAYEQVAPGEPTSWIKVHFTSKEVWVKSSYLDEKNQVKSEILNLRSGPGTSHQRIGQLKKGDTVTPLDNKDGWTRISPLLSMDSYAFIAEQYVKLTGKITPEEATQIMNGVAVVPSQAKTIEVKSAEAKPAETKPAEVKPTEAKPAEKKPVEAMPAVTKPETVKPAKKVESTPEEVVVKEEAPVKVAQPEAPVDTVPPVAAPAQPAQKVAPSVPIVAVEPPENSEPEESVASKTEPVFTEETTKERVVRREGIVRPNGSPAAPAYYVLCNIENNKIMNFLYVEKGSEIKLKPYVKKKVIVNGPESIEARWPKIPMLTVRSIELLNPR